MATELIHLGFGNILAINRIIAVLSPNSAPTKRLIQEGKNNKLIIDMTNGRKTKSVLITDGGYIIQAAITAETIAARLAASRGSLVLKEQTSEKDEE